MADRQAASTAGVNPCCWMRVWLKVSKLRGRKWPEEGRVAARKGGEEKRGKLNNKKTAPGIFLHFGTQHIGISGQASPVQVIFERKPPKSGPIQQKKVLSL